MAFLDTTYTDLYTYIKYLTTMPGPTNRPRALPCPPPLTPSPLLLLFSLTR